MGVLVDPAGLRAWQRTLLQRIRNSDCAELALIVSCGESESADCGIEPHLRRPKWLPRLAAEWIDRACLRLERGIECENDAFARCDTADALSGVPTVALDGVNGRLELTPELQARLVESDLDAIVALCACPPWQSLGGVARYGLWRLDSGHDLAQHGGPPGFWEVCRGEPVTRMALSAIGADGEVRRLADAICGTHLLSLKLSRSNAYWTALSLVPRTLARLYREGAVHNRKAGCGRSASPGAARHAAPGPTAIASYMLRNVGRRARERARRTLGFEQWVLLVRAGVELDLKVSRFKPIIPPSDRYWADPHVVRRDGRYFVFVEEYLYSTGRGHIAVVELDAQGEVKGVRKVLEQPYHLSYPHVFEHAGELYMVPESMEDRSVSLYRCVGFPDRWEFVRTLLHDVRAVDSTLLHRAGKWWLFAGIAENEGSSASEELFLFFSDCLLTGTWIAHPLNPIVSDVARARPAGAIQQRAGRLYRPSQDCAVRYGYAIRINEITELSTETYEEIEIACISPDWNPRVLATHTLGHEPGLTVVDALLLRSKLRQHRSLSSSA